MNDDLFSTNAGVPIFQTCRPVSSSALLPIQKYKREILYSVERHSVTIISGPTGSGKTTQIPQFLLEQGWAGIVCTQPRRIAAISMATRVAQEIGKGPLGGLIGYTVRFDNCTSSETICRYVTDGILFRECLYDPLLSKYSIIIIDEAHERSLHTDLLLSLLKKILIKRPELRIIISSATLQSDQFKTFFTFPKRDLHSGKRIYGPTLPSVQSEPDKTKTEESVPVAKKEEEAIAIEKFIPVERFEPAILRMSQRTFPVEIQYLLDGPDEFIENDEVIIDAVTRLVKQINSDDGPGDILVFLSGRAEIEKCHEILLSMNSEIEAKTLETEDENQEALLELFKSKKKTKTTSSTSTVKGRPLKLECFQLYAGLDKFDQLKIFEPSPPGTRKVILATNIAEASITIDGIVFVIDSGREKIKVWQAEECEEKMLLVPISKASAQQRSGRAGRTRPGKVFRLYTKKFFESEFLTSSIPDINLINFTPILLQLKMMGIVDTEKFDFLSKPSQRSVQCAEMELFELKATGKSIERKYSGENLPLNPFGREMAQLPLEPNIAHFFLKAAERQCPSEGAALAAMLTIQYSASSNSTFNFFIGNNLKMHRRFWVEEGDHMTLLSIFMSYLANSAESVKFCQKYGLNLKLLISVHRLYLSLLSYLSKVFKRSTVRSVSMSPDEISICLRKCLISAFPFNVIRSDELNSSYQHLHRPKSSQFHIHPTSVLFKRLPPLLLYSQMTETTKKFVRFTSIVEPEWLEEIHPDKYNYRRKNKM